MGKEKKISNLKVIVAEFKVSMYCNACERTVAKAISKIKGVEKFTTEMKKHKVTVTGKLDPEKVLKKLKKKTGKRVEMVVNNNNNSNNNKEESSKKENATPNGDNGRTGVSKLDLIPPFLFDYSRESQVLMMFSDENPNACSVM